MKRYLKVVSRKQSAAGQELGSSRRCFVSEQLPDEQHIAQIEKAGVTAGTLNELARTISHYLNSPLTVLLGKVEVLARMNEDGGLSKQEVERFVEASKREIFRIDGIVKAFSDICEVQHKTFPPGVRLLDVEREIRNRTKDTCFLR